MNAEVGYRGGEERRSRQFVEKSFVLSDANDGRNKQCVVVFVFLKTQINVPD